MDTPTTGDCPSVPDSRDWNCDKQHCLACGRKFPGNRIPYYDKGFKGYLCTTCSMAGKHGPEQTTKPKQAKRDPRQMVLGELACYKSKSEQSPEQN